TNTSALPVGRLADTTVSPEHVIGLHFFNPVSRMRLVEVVIAKQTSDETRDRSLGFVRQIGKLPVIVRDNPGFLVNRVLFPYLLDAAELFERGLEADKIDDALVHWGMPMGPVRLIDEIGVDISIDIGNTLEKAYGRSGPLCGGESRRFPGGCGLRNDFRDRFRAVPWRATALRGALRTEEGGRRIRAAGTNRGEIFALRDFAEACP